MKKVYFFSKATRFVSPSFLTEPPLQCKLSPLGATGRAGFIPPPAPQPGRLSRRECREKELSTAN